MNQENHLVSIITPCYNGEHCVSRLLDSIIAQTYRPIEFIIVNDGSTDGTLSVLESYVTKFQNAGIEFIIVNQENKGLGGAINAGLKRFTGDYLCWPDADDYLEPTSLEERVRILDSYPKYAVVSSDAYVRKADYLVAYTGKYADSFKYKNDPHQFEHLLNGHSIFCSGCHMARSSMFLDVNPDREIYPARRGQNWQLLLPMYYKYEWVFIDKPLYNYLKYPVSMSSNEDTLKSYLYRYKEHETILYETLKKIENVQGVDLQSYYKHIYNTYSVLKMETAIRFGSKDLFSKVYAEKKAKYGLNHRDRMLKIRMTYPMINQVYSKLRRVKIKSVFK